MRSVIFSTVLTFLIMTNILPMAPNNQGVKATGAIYIRADGSIDPPTASIISLDNVTYTFTDNINASIFVQRNNIVVDGAGHIVQGNGSGTGIDLSFRRNVTLKNVQVTNFFQGIYLNSSTNNTLIGNTAYSNIEHSGRGICLSYSTNNILTSNTASNNFEGILLMSSDNNVFIGNNASDGNDGVFLMFSGNNTFIENNFSNNIYGIDLGGSSNNTFISNTASSNDNIGIYLYYSSNNTFISNIAFSNLDYGIYLWYLGNNTFIGNNISNSFTGIRLKTSLNNTFTGNNVKYSNNCGIALEESSSNNLFADNVVFSTLDYGIYLQESCGNNTFTGNTISNSNYGTSIISSSGNFYFHNNFINNTFQADTTTGNENSWDNGLEGNYWSDYNGTDMDSDGIGDTEYVLDVGNTDHYPLMGVFSNFNTTSEHYVQTICNSTISEFQHNGTAINFDVTGENDTAGFCRICIPRTLMNESYKVFVNGTEVPCNLLPCSNTTHSYLYFTYNLSRQEVIVVPEFPTLTSLLLLLIVLAVAVSAYKRKLLKTQCARYPIYAWSVIFLIPKKTFACMQVLQWNSLQNFINSLLVVCARAQHLLI